jgi:hypothetical protein
MAEVLLEIAQNASIRGMRVDCVNLFSVLDFITYVCPSHNCKYATQLRNSLKNEMCSDMVIKCKYLKFNGKGQKNTKYLKFNGKV